MSWRLALKMPSDLERLCDAHAQGIFAFVLNLTRNDADTRDVLQERAGSRPSSYFGIWHPSRPQMSISSMGGGFIINWNSESNRTYQLLSTTNLSQPFTPFGNSIHSGGANTSYTNASAVGPAQFIQVLQLPSWIRLSIGIDRLWRDLTVQSPIYHLECGRTTIDTSGFLTSRLRLAVTD